MGNHRTFYLLALGATLQATSPGTEPPPPKAEAAATVTVTAEGTPVEILKTPNPVIVIDKATIEAQGSENLADLLQALLPGQVFTTGGVGTSSNVALGGRAQDTVVTLDGLRLSDATGFGAVNLSWISLAGIDRIEVQQGPCSTRFGSDAQAGVIALYSAGHAAEGLTGQVRAGVGTQAIRQATFAPAYGWGTGWVRAALNAQQEDGATPADKPYRTAGTYLGLGQQLGRDTLVTVSYLNTFNGVPLPISYADYGTTPRWAGNYIPFRQDFSRTEVMDASLRSAILSTLTGELTVGQVLQTRLEPNYVDSTPTEHYTSRRNQANGALTWRPFAVTSLQAGFDAYEETAWIAGNLDPAKGRHLAVFLENQTEVGGGVRLVASVRKGKDRLSFPGGPALQETSANRTTWKAGVNWLAAEGLRFYVSAGNAFANPLLFQAIYNAQYQGQTLENERSFTRQAGATYEHGPWRVGVDLVRTRYGNLVYYDPNGGVLVPSPYGDYYTGIYRNGTDLRFQSAQVNGGYRTEAWSLMGFYRNQEFRNETGPESERFSKGAVVRRPFQSLGLNGHRMAGKVRLEARWSWIGSRYDYGLPSAFKQHFNDLGVAASMPLSRDLTLAVRGEHLMQPRTSREQWLSRERDFQNDASQVFGYPAQPPTGTLEVRYRF